MGDQAGVAPAPGVGRTALGVARVRAAESRRPDRLFDDPYAEAFVTAAPDAVPQHSVAGRGADVAKALASHVVLRTRFFDDYLLGACAAGTRQVVLLAAGLDTRAFRLEWPSGVQLFEVDLPDVLAFKEGVLGGQAAEAACGRTVVAADLRGDWVSALTSAGFDPAVGTAWLVEGLLVYLSADEAERLLAALGECSVAGSRLALEHGAAASRLAAQADRPSSEVVGLWKGGLGTHTPDWLTMAGWSVHVHDRDEVASAYGRGSVDASGSGFITAIRG